MSDRIDRASDAEFIKAIVENVPQQATKNETNAWGAAFVAATAVKHALKKR